MLWGQWREPAEGGLPLTCSHDILVGDDVAQALRTVLLDPRAGHRRDCTVALSGVRLGRPPLDLDLHGVLHFRGLRSRAISRVHGCNKNLTVCLSVCLAADSTEFHHSSKLLGFPRLS
jgi:hypothetical protein